MAEYAETMRRHKAAERLIRIYDARIAQLDGKHFSEEIGKIRRAIETPEELETMARRGWATLKARGKG